ncbi:MAG: hypothetical protein DLD55_05370 [candidate division SR1 bacterium]|nr:MAG: hypothetical protein DLD55_05370 [candidate division SR1 bacterium]
MIKVAKICFTFFYSYNKYDLLFFLSMLMTDPIPTQTSTPIPTPVHQENGAKKPFFGGGQQVFENLEKFERISNPTEESQNFDFDFTDVVPEISEDNPSLQPEDAELPLKANVEDEGGAPLENIGLENIFQSTKKNQKENQTLDINNYEFDSQEIEKDEFDGLELEPFEGGESETPDQEAVSKPEVAEPEIQLPETEEQSETPELEPFEGGESETPDQEIVSKPEVAEPEIQLPETEEKPFTWKQAQDQATSDSPVSTDSTQETKELPSNSETPEEGEVSEVTTEEQVHLEMENEPKSDFSSLIVQFNALLEQCRALLNLENKIQKADLSSFEIIGNNTEKSMINYQISQEVEDELPKLILKKREKDFVHDEEHEYILSLTTLEKDKNLIVAINDYQLYEEEKDLQDPVKQLQVGDKLNKFSFLFSQRLSELQEQWETLEAEKEKMKAFRSIFRNF